MESRQPLILLTCDGTATFPWVWSYLADVQRLLDDGTVLLEYALGPKLSGVGVVTNRDARVYPLPPQDVIDKILEQFLPTLREPLLERSEIDRHVQLAKQVYADLIGPIRDQIQ